MLNPLWEKQVEKKYHEILYLKDYRTTYKRQHGEIIYTSFLLKEFKVNQNIIHGGTSQNL